MAVVGSLSVNLSLDASAFQAGLAAAAKAAQGAKDKLKLELDLNIKGLDADKLGKTPAASKLTNLAAIQGRLANVGTLGFAAATSALEGNVTKAVQSIGNLSTELLAIPFNVAAMGARVLGAAVEGTFNAFGGLLGLIPAVGGGLSTMIGGFGMLAAGPFKLLAGVLEKIADTIPALGRALTELATPFGHAASAAVHAAAEYERLEIVFKSMTGSMEVGSKLIKDIYQFAAVTPFRAPELVSGTQRLMAFGMDPERAFNTVKVMGDLMAASSLPLDEALRRTTGIMGKMWAMPTVHARELRQLTEAAIPAWTILEQHIIKTRGRVEGSIQKMVELGKISGFEAVMAMLEGASRFGGLMEEQSQTVIGLWSNLQDNLTILGAEFGKKLIDTFDIKGIQRDLISGIQFLRANLNTLDPLLAGIKGSFLAIRDLAMTGFRALADSFLGMGKGVTDLKVITDTWYIATLEVLDGITTGILQFAGMAAGAFRSIMPTVEALIEVFRTLIDIMKTASAFAFGVALATKLGAESLIKKISELPEFRSNEPPKPVFIEEKKLKPAEPEVGISDLEKGIIASEKALAAAQKASSDFFARQKLARINFVAPGKLDEIMKVAGKVAQQAVDRDIISVDGMKTRLQELRDTLERATDVGKAQDAMRGFADALGEAFSGAGDKARAVDALTGAVERYSKAAAAAEKAKPIGEQIKSLSLKEQIDKLNDGIAEFANKGITALERFQEEMFKLEGLKTVSDQLSPLKHQMEAIEKARTMKLDLLPAAHLEELKTRGTEIKSVALTAMRDLRAPAQQMLHDSVQFMEDMVTQLDPTATIGAQIQGLTIVGDMLFAVGAEQVKKMKDLLPAGEISERLLRLAEQDFQLSLPIKPIFEDRDFKLAAAEKMEKLLAMTREAEVARPAAAQIGSREAAQSIIRFREQGKERESVLDRLLEVEKASNRRIDDLYQLWKGLEKDLRDRGKVVSLGGG